MQPHLSSLLAATRGPIHLGPQDGILTHDTINPLVLTRLENGFEGI